MPEALPQLSGDRLFIGDGGLETSLIFHQGLDLPDFAAFTLLADDAGRDVVGGCCDTDHRHVEQACAACVD